MTPAEVEALASHLEQWSAGDHPTMHKAAAALRQLVRERDEEREECANVAEAVNRSPWSVLTGLHIAAAIRARKEDK